MNIKIKKSKHKKVQFILNNKLSYLYISHEEIHYPINDFGDEITLFIGWFEPIKPMSLKSGKTNRMSVAKDNCLLD